MPPDERTISYVDTTGAGAGRSFVAPYLVVAIHCRTPTVPPARFSIAEVQDVVLARGNKRELSRYTEDGRGRLRITLADSLLSTEHARLVKTGNTWFVEDAGSKNGTHVNGKRVDRRRLEDGDVIEIGSTLLLFHCEVSRTVGDPLDVDLTDSLGPITALSTLSVPLDHDFARLRRIAASEAPVLLLGDSGSGKEVVAREVHRLSGRRGAFTALNCGAIPQNLVESQLFGHRRGAFSGADTSNKGLVRAADAGTLFLDEVAELSEPPQIALLRVLQEGEVVPIGENRPIPVDVRVIAATHAPLRARADAGKFRHDLFSRLAGFELKLPPLCDRREDIGLLVSSLLQRHAGAGADRVTLTRSAARALLNYHWPMNVRELEHALRAAILIAGDGAIDLEHLPAAVRKARKKPTAPPARPPDVEVEYDELVELLRRYRGNVSAVARDIGRSRVHVHRKLKRYEIDPTKFRP